MAETDAEIKNDRQKKTTRGQVVCANFMYFSLDFFKKMAEEKGFEPSIGYEPIHAFQACDFNHSSTPPTSAITGMNLKPSRSGRV